MDVARVCSDLVRINTENPPGRTDVAVEYVADILESLGYLPASPGIRGATGMSVQAHVILNFFSAATWMWCRQGLTGGHMTPSPA